MSPRAAGPRFYVPDPTSPLYETAALASGHQTTLLKSAAVVGNLQSNDDIDLEPGSRVTGNISAGGRVSHRGATVSGRVTEGAPPVALPVLPTPVQARALAARSFDDEHTFTNAVINDVVFVAGDVQIRGSLNGTGTIIARGDIRLSAVEPGDRVQLDASTRMSLIALRGIHVGMRRPLRGVLVAGREIELAQKSHLDGLLIAHRAISLDQGSTVAFAPLDQTPPTIIGFVPPDGTLLANALPAISAALADDLSGVDPASLKLAFDGIDRTSAARLTASGFTFTPATPLADGAHDVVVAVQDRAANLAQAHWTFTTDVTPPALTLTGPAGQIIAGSQPPIAIAYSDATSGVDLTSLRVSLDTTDLTASCTLGPATSSCVLPAPALGNHNLTAAIRDRAGNAASASTSFQVVSAAPTISITSPAGGSYFRSPSIQVNGLASGGVTTVTVNGQPATLGQNGSFATSVTLVQGLNPIVAIASDAAGNQATAAVAVILDTTPPSVTLVTPAPGMLTNQPQVNVAGAATDDNGIAAVTIGGQPVNLTAGQFATTVPLVEGANQISASATDLAGNVQTVSVAVTRFSIPTVGITSPQDLSYLSATTVTVSGTVSPVVGVSVNGVPAALSGTSFSATGVPLIEGGNTLTATATDAQGHVGIATINVVRDLTPPHLAIYTPAAGATVAATSVSVSGLVNDIVAGTVNASNVAVTVNGVAAAVVNRSFMATVPLQPGDNALTAVALDAGGNRGQASITIRQATPASPQVVAIAGGGQSARIGTALPQPLVAKLVDAGGQPVAGKLVLFQVRGNDGSLDGGSRNLAVTTDANGQAQAHLTLGTRAGAGNQVVGASAVGFAGPAPFLASALPGPAARIVVDSGDQQLGVAGQALPRPLVATVVDSGSNRLAGIMATFRTVKGSGKFANGAQTLSLITDSDGRLIVPFTTDPAEGVANNVVEATVDALPGGPVASFVASASAAGDPGQTAVSGVVLDNTNLPVAGVTMRIRGSTLTAVTDAQGQFQILPAPVGTIKLIVDGSTAQRPGAWPDLELDLTTVPGRNNTPRMPIYLLPLDLASGLQVDELHGGHLTLPQLPGFALDILPGSVTFPGGGRSGLVSVTVVHSDKVPMVPSFGQQPRLIVTIQPAGARFDPPARLTLPNVEGLAPGQVTEFYSFDHDLGTFVSIGPGTVSDDATVVTSNVGVGILKAGWHCCGFPQGSGSPNHCPDCTDCTGDQCVQRRLCKHCNNSPLNACDGEGGCRTGRQLIPKIGGVINGGQLDVAIGARTQLGRGDPLALCPPTKSNPCFVAVRDQLLAITHSCASINLQGAVLEETVGSMPSPPCPRIDVTTGIGCTVDAANQLIAPDGTPCKDTHAICGDIPPGTCSLVHTQSFYLDRLLIKSRTITFNFNRNAAGCTVTVQ